MKDINIDAVIARKNLKVMRLQMKEGALLAEHASKAHVLIVCVKGQGVFYINQTAHDLSPGTVLEMEPNVLHSVQAHTALELIVSQMQLAAIEATG